MTRDSGIREDERDFRWRDGERLIRFGAGSARELGALLGERGASEYDLLSTERALGAAPAELMRSAARVHLVASGGVPEAAGALVDEVEAKDLVALGGGRVVDVAKAIAAVHRSRVAAIPTTLSGAEMTAIHRLPEGRDAPGGLVRPALVIADPELMATAPEPDLRASAMNALAHGAEAIYTPFANPVASLAALRGAELIASGLDAGTERDNAASGALALGATLCGFAVDSAGLALHHVVSQSTVRVMATPHADTNAAVLPVVLDVMSERAPEAIAKLAAALGTSPTGLRERVHELAGGRRSLGEVGADETRIPELLDVIEARPDLPVMTPDPPDREGLRRIVEAAW